MTATFLLWCRMIVISTNGGGPMSCHPEIIELGQVERLNGIGWVKISGNWHIDCNKGGPYKVIDGLWLCKNGSEIYKGDKDIPWPPPLLPKLQDGGFRK